MQRKAASSSSGFRFLDLRYSGCGMRVRNWVCEMQLLLRLV